MSAPMRSPTLALSVAVCLFAICACAPMPAAQTAPEPAATAPAPTPGLDAPPVPGAPRPLNIDAPSEQKLPNGLRVVLAERRGVQVVTAQLVVLAGSEVDPAQRAGLASITAGLLTKGTRKHSAQALARAAESLGGALESGAGWNQSSVSITVTVPKLDEALELVSEAVRQPAFAQAELDRLRVQTLDDLKIAYSQPGTLASQAAQRMLFGDGAYGHPAGGTPQSLPRITRADLVAMHAAKYRPDNAVLVLAGDLDAATALRLASRHFGNWKAAADLRSAPAPAAVGTSLASEAAIIDMPQSGQAAVVVVAPIPPLGDQRAAAAVMNSVLGGGYSSRLNQEIRIRRGLSYGAGSGLDARREGGALRVVVQTKNESAAEVLGLVQAQIDRLVATHVGDAELAARKATLIGDFSRSVETTAGLGAVVRSMIVAGVPLSDLRTRIDALGAVSAADVQRFAAANLGAGKRRVAVAGEAAKFSTALKSIAPSLIEVPAAALDLERSGRLTSR
jgi:zinc protease